ncbi:hypothetical protein AVEN_100888-1 [Araneus ventricosus]|uniref:Bestrophin homolog n=1 Tax=Araneus ventricosus TaxID=182803 RepID=A0A4Y2AYB3_ARAVE|nr:hypothetical protein AVEN_100888-1 [Araneus ventricosus]
MFIACGFQLPTIEVMDIRNLLTLECSSVPGSTAVCCEKGRCEFNREFENIVRYFERFIDVIPLSFVLGFYVSLVIGRWWSQFDAIPWPDRSVHVLPILVSI